MSITSPTRRCNCRRALLPLTLPVQRTLHFPPLCSILTLVCKELAWPLESAQVPEEPSCQRTCHAPHNERTRAIIVRLVGDGASRPSSPLDCEMGSSCSQQRHRGLRCNVPHARTHQLICWECSLHLGVGFDSCVAQFSKNYSRSAHRTIPLPLLRRSARSLATPTKGSQFLIAGLRGLVWVSADSQKFRKRS